MRVWSYILLHTVRHDAAEASPCWSQSGMMPRKGGQAWGLLFLLLIFHCLVPWVDAQDTDTDDYNNIDDYNEYITNLTMANYDDTEYGTSNKTDGVSDAEIRVSRTKYTHQRAMEKELAALVEYNPSLASTYVLGTSVEVICHCIPLPIHCVLNPLANLPFLVHFKDIAPSLLGQETNNQIKMIF